MAKREKTGGGSRKGIPNKVTADARAAIGMFVEGNAPRLQTWLDAVADGVFVKDGKGSMLCSTPPNPIKAFELFQSVVEYHIPKLARTELTGKDGKDLALVQTAPNDAKL